MSTPTYYHRTGYCGRCDRYYGNHDEGCPLEDVVPECMVPVEDRQTADPFHF